MAREPGEENVNAADGGVEVRVRPATDGRKNSAAYPYSLLSGLECYLMLQNGELQEEDEKVGRHCCCCWCGVVASGLWE
jgi:hypothetical protein